MLIDIKKQLKRKIEWKQDPVNLAFFYSPDLEKADYWLRMNDFPEEPLWTLFWKGQELEIEDTPVLWNIKYNDS